MRLFNFVIIAALFVSGFQPHQFAYAQTRKSAAASAKTAFDWRKAAEQITAQELKNYLEFVSSDEMEGRDTPSRGLDTTAKFLALNLAQVGIKPAGDAGTFFQKIALNRYLIDAEKSSAILNGQTFSYGEDFITRGGTSGDINAPLVYVGHGWVVKSKNINPYEGVDIRDKIIVVAGGTYPKGIAPTDLPIAAFGTDWEHPYAYAQRNGAKGVIILPTFRTLANWEARLQQSLNTGVMNVEKFQAAAAPPTSFITYEGTSSEIGYVLREGLRIPAITPSVSMIQKLFQGEQVTAAAVLSRGVTGDAGASFEFNPQKKLRLTVNLKKLSLLTQNVVGILEGSDPILKNEYVAVGAHYDHIGIGNPLNGDAINNGADDDGSGTVAVLAMARALATSSVRPKRSILFVWHAGEEKGLWGSDYFTRFPTVPLGQVIAQLNIDMIGRSRKADDANPRNKDLSGENEIYVIGSKMMSTELGELSENVNNSYLKLDFNYRYDDPKDPERFFYRSDHYNYAKNGVPIIFYFNGPHEDYHGQNDEVEKIDFVRMERITRTVFATAWELASRANRPGVDKPLSVN